MGHAIKLQSVFCLLSFRYKLIYISIVTRNAHMRGVRKCKIWYEEVIFINFCKFQYEKMTRFWSKQWFSLHTHLVNYWKITRSYRNISFHFWWATCLSVIMKKKSKWVVYRIRIFSKCSFITIHDLSL